MAIQYPNIEIAHTKHQDYLPDHLNLSHKNQIQYLRNEIDEVRTEILKIEIKSIQENQNVQANKNTKCAL